MITNIFENLYKDCKEKSTTLMALLKRAAEHQKLDPLYVDKIKDQRTNTI